MHINRLILYGSQATRHWFPEFRDGPDIDFVARPGTPRPKLNKFVEVHYSPAFEWLLDNREHNINGIASPEALYTIKLSHAYWPIHWYKTMHDISFFQDRGVSYIPEFHDLLYNDWIKMPRRDKDRMNFDVPNERFFKSTVTRHIAHDQLHQLVKYDETPKYLSIKPDLTMAAISDMMFDALSEEDKFKVVREEAFVIALERRIVPKRLYQNSLAISAAYSFSLQKNIIDLNKGAVPKFMVANWNRIKETPPEFFELCAKVGDWAAENNVNYGD